MSHEPIHVTVVLGDPRLPYAYGLEGRFGPEEIEADEKLRAALSTLEGFRFDFLDDHSTLMEDVQRLRPQLVLNLCDTGFRNKWEHERNIPAFLEMLEIPYTGADPIGMVLSNDKALVSAACQLRGVPVPEQTFVDLAHESPRLPSRYPALIKPNVSAGSFGITDKSLVHSDEEAVAYLEWLKPLLDVPEAIIQDYLPGAEYTLGLIGNPDLGFTVLPPLEIDFSELDPELPPILTYGSKADPDSPYWNALSFKQAELHPGSLEKLVGACSKMFGRLGFRDYARFDFRCDRLGTPRLLDANTNPTWYHNGKMAIMAEWAGHDYAQFLRLILEAAIARYGLR